jgi:hypothetical protein
MKSFRQYLNEQEGVQPTWKATKDHILDYWKTLRSDVPLSLSPISYEHKGSTYGEDGVRITGSPQFIASVLGKLKEFINYESETTKLALSYRQTKSPSLSAVGATKTSYVCYVQVKERGKGRQ